MHVRVKSSLFTGSLNETQDAGAGSGTESALCKRCNMRLNASSQTYIPALKGMQTWKRTYYADMHMKHSCVDIMYINMHALKTCMHCLPVIYSLSLPPSFIAFLQSHEKKPISFYDFTGTFMVSPPPDSFASHHHLPLLNKKEGKHRREKDTWLPLYNETGFLNGL